MKIRKLKKEDASLMLEWMHDKSVTGYMGKNFSSMTIKDCLNFIINSENDDHDLHLAVCNDQDAYMGTVSLKNINMDKRTAEFAIIMRKGAMGKGFSKFGMNEILKTGFEKLKLNYIYWYVSKENKRAIRFYDKNLFKRADMKTVDCLDDIFDKKQYMSRKEVIYYIAYQSDM